MKHMTTLNLNAIDPAELMPLPETPDSFGPRDDEERQIYALIQEAMDSGPGKRYASVDDLAVELNARLERLLKNR